MSVATQIEQMGVPSDAFDTIATSGDSARSALFRGVVGHKVYHIGQPDETAFFAPLSLIDQPIEITRVDLDAAEGIVCTGPFDPLADPSVNRPAFLAAKTRGLKLLCANPDIIVDRGEVREWCAGALAQLYTEMGGESLYFGKPHPPIYDLARRRLAQIADVADADILAIGDGIGTDVAGAMGEDLDVLFISGGLAAQETGTGPTGGPDEAKLAAYLTTHQSEPRFTIGMLR
jgi:ribonucleotide monophosphatase NagD (HAD superfamily)